MDATRLEHDTFGPIAVPAARLWGAQTQRSLELFRISVERMPQELLAALALVKRSAARVNLALGGLDARTAEAIVQAADEVIAGRHADEFPLSVWQTGSGTQTNMNMNEVLANRASILLGGAPGPGRLVHPNDDVNRGQSSNDVFPAAMHVAAVVAIEQGLRPALQGLHRTLADKAAAFAGIVKIGRTHLQDAVPLTLGQEISGWAAQVAQSARHVETALPRLRELAIGGTAVGTGLNAHPQFGGRVAADLSHHLGTGFVSAPNKFEALAAHDALVFLHGALKTCAAALTKVANDVRWLASGERARQLDHAGQGQPDPVRGADDGVLSGVRQRRRGDLRRRERQFRAERLQAGADPQRAAEHPSARRCRAQLRRALRPGHRAEPRADRRTRRAFADAGDRAESAHRL
jgi:fumarate hydratase class II